MVRPAETPPPTDIAVAYAPPPDVTSSPTAFPVAIDTQAPTATPSVEVSAVPVAQTDANIRSGPGLSYPVVDIAPAGTPLNVLARTPAGDWLLLDSGGWIYAALVANAPDVPVASLLPPPPPTPLLIPLVPAVATETPYVPAAPPPAAPAATEIPAIAIAEGIGEGNPNAFTCIGGCATPPNPSCPIKGNVNSRGEKIYHMPGQRDYDRTDIKPEEGDAWFCTPEEAEAAGFRRAKR